MRHKLKVKKIEKKIFAFLALFGITTITLKLINVIDWPWYMVTLPFSVFWIFFFGCFFVAIICGLVIHSVNTLLK